MQEKEVVFDKEEFSGVKIAAWYSLPPCKLKLCGPREKEANQKIQEVLFKLGSKKHVPSEETKEILSSLETAYPYYKLLARSSGYFPFSEEVVRNYWVGGELLEKVKPDDLKKVILEDFSKADLIGKEAAERLTTQIPDEARPHHSFDVLIFGPKAGRISDEGKILDLCRIAWGRVEEIKNERLTVFYKPIVGKGRLSFGEERQREILWERSFDREVKVGDWVSFHWGEGCEVLSSADVENLEKYTSLHLKLANS